MFFFTFRLYLLGVKLKKKLVPFNFLSLKIKNQFNFPLLSKCDLQVKHYLIFSFQNQHDKTHFGSLHGIILIFFGFFQHSVGHFVAVSIFSHC